MCNTSAENTGAAVIIPPTPSAAAKTLLQAGHVIPDKIRYSAGMGGGVLNYMLKHKVRALHLQRVGV